MRKILSLVLAILMIASVSVIAANAAGAQTATVTITGFNNESSDTQTYAVGEEFTAYVALNCSQAYEDGMISSLKAAQTYDSDVLELTDAYSADDGMVTDLETMFPVCSKGSCVANAHDIGAIKYNASTPSEHNAFKFNSDDTMLIVAHYRVKEAGTASIGTDITTLAVPNFYLTKIVNKGVVIDGYADKFTVTVSLSAPAAPAGSTVSGTVTCGGEESEAITVKLSQDGTVVYETSVSGALVTKTSIEAAYSIEGVADGTYTMTVSKKNHIDREYEVVVSGDTVKDAKIHLLGDIDGDGAVSTYDFALANAHAKGVTVITDPYVIAAGNIDGEGDITTFDAAMINSHAKGVNSLW